MADNVMKNYIEDKELVNKLKAVGYGAVIEGGTDFNTLHINYDLQGMEESFPIQQKESRTKDDSGTYDFINEPLVKTFIETFEGDKPFKNATEWAEWNGLDSSEDWENEFADGERFWEDMHHLATELKNS